MFQAVRNERRRGLVVGSLDSDPEDPKFKSGPETAKKKQHTFISYALVAQRQSVYNIVGHPT
jgi:hypothetical protein